MKPQVCLAAIFAVSLPLHAATVVIDTLDVRGTGIFGHPSITMSTLNGGAFPGTLVADPLDFQITYGTLDLDGDGTANDSVTFTLQVLGGGANQRAFGQGIDTGFGSLNNVTATVTGVSGSTTDSGDIIVFDGFIGANVGLGSGEADTRNVDINGTTVNLATTGAGFQFVVNGLDFSPTSTVLFDNSGGSGGSIVARSYDLQFSTIPEPSRALLLCFAGGLIALRRKR